MQVLPGWAWGLSGYRGWQASSGIGVYEERVGAAWPMHRVAVVSHQGMSWR